MKISLCALLIGVGGLLMGTSFGAVHKCVNGRNPICQSIITLKPGLSHNEAFQLSNVFFKVSRSYKLDPRMMVAIAFQESTLELGAVRKVFGLDMDKDSNFKEVTVGSDFCMMQINAGNIKRYQLDAGRLLTDAYYCIESGAKILQSFSKKYGRLEENWWTRYNSCTPAYREMYQKLVSKHWDKILPNPEANTCKSDSGQDRISDPL